MAGIAEFEALITQLMSSDNAVRGQAETTFQELKKLQPDTLGSFLIQLVRSSSNEQVRAMCTVLLRKATARDDSSIWPNLQPATQVALKVELLAAIEQEHSTHLRKKLCDTVAEVATSILEEGQWPELLPWMFNSTKSPSPALREAPLLIFAHLGTYLGDALKPYLATIRTVLLSAFSDDSGDVRLAALRATSSFLTSIDDPAALQPFQELVPFMLQTISHALNANQEDAARESLQLFVEVVDSNAVFFRQRINDVVNAMLMIATTTTLEDSTRQLGMEFLVDLAEKAPGMCRKVPSFVQRVLPAALNLMLEIEDDPDWYNTSEEEETEYTNFDVGEESLDRLAIALGGKTVVPIAFSIIPVFLQNPDWRYRQAALIAISQIGEGCAKQIESNLGPIIEMTLRHFGDAHPRVRWAAINTIGQLSTDFGPDLQTAFHAQVLPCLIQVMDDKSTPRVQSHAAAAVINFTEHCTKELITPYLDGLLGKLHALLQSGSTIVQEQAITAIASVADCAGDTFIKYYDVFMPIFKQILALATTKEARLLRGKAMECISLVGIAVGKDKFGQDAKDVMETLMKAQSEELPPDDPQISYMLQAWARICRCLEEDFIPYLPIVMPPLLQSASLKPDVTISDADEAEGDQEGMDTIQVGDKRISIRTSVLEEKATACNMICCYVNQLKDGFFTYVDPVAKLMVPLMKFYYHDEVRQAAVSSMPDLVRSASLALEKQGGDRTYVKSLLDFILGTLIEAMKAEPDLDILVTMLESTNESLDLVGEGCLSPDQLQALGVAVDDLIKESNERRSQRQDKKKSVDFDDEEKEQLEEEDEKEDEILDQIACLVGTIFRTHKTAFYPVFERLLPHFLALLHPSRSAAERRIGICIFDDLVEHTGTQSQSYFQHFLPALLNYVTDEDADVRQAAVYGIGVCAKFGEQQFAPVCSEALHRLTTVIRAPDAREKANVSATDNAVSAVGKICEFQSAAVDVGVVLPMWLSYLPLTGDAEEAKLVYSQLCSWLELNHPALLGPGNHNVPKIISIFADSLGTEFVTPEVSSRMVTLLKRMQTGLPPDVLNAAWSNLSPAQRERLQTHAA